MADLNLAAIDAANARAAEIGPGVAFACEVLRSMARGAEGYNPARAQTLRDAEALIRREERESL